MTPQLPLYYLKFITTGLLLLGISLGLLLQGWLQPDAPLFHFLTKTHYILASGYNNSYPVLIRGTPVNVFVYTLLCLLLILYLCLRFCWAPFRKISLSRGIFIITVTAFCLTSLLQAHSQWTFFQKGKHGQPASRKTKWLQFPLFQFTQYCKNKLPGNHRCLLQTDDADLYLRGDYVLLRYYLYPLDIEHFNRLPVEGLIFYRSNASRQNIPQGFEIQEPPFAADKRMALRRTPPS